MRIGITQREETLPERGEVRDALDVRLAELLWSIGLVPVPLINTITDTGEYLEAVSVDAFVLSGGGTPGLMKQRDRLEQAILAHSARFGSPVFGICRGMQVIVRACGGRLTPLEGHIATRHIVQGSLVPEAREVNSFHEFGVLPQHIGSELEAVAMAEDGSVEAVQHRTLPWTGILWHPEREHPFVEADLRLLEGVLASTEAR